MRKRSSPFLTTTNIWLLYLQLVAAITIGASADKSDTSYDHYYKDSIGSTDGDGGRSLIVGGSRVESESKYPFFGVLIGTRQYPNEFGNDTIRATTLCGSSLIAKDVVLTIGRCVNHTDMIAVHVVFEAIVNNDTDRQVIRASNWIIDEDELDEDKTLGLVYLENEAIGVNIVNPSVHDNDNNDPNIVHPALNDTLTTMGFGVTDENNDGTVDSAVNSDTLMEVEIIVNDTAICDLDYNETFNETQQFCAGGNGTGACLGDSGGPALDMNGDVVGIVSFGIISCGIFPTIFTRVNGYKDFIKDNVCNRNGIDNPEWCSPPTTAAPAYSGLGFSCFAESNKAEVKNNGVIQQKYMKDLSIGDSVHVGNGIYEPVYSFGHYLPSIKSRMLQIKTVVVPSSSNNDEQTTITAPLRISPNHMVMTASSSKGTIPASQLQVGDELLTSSSDVVRRVQKIDTILAHGMYAPFTPSGKIVVDGILVSTYIAFEDNEGLEFGVSSWLVKISHQWMAHAGSFPHRFMCYHYSNNEKYCANETYSSEGIADGVYGSLMFYKNIFEMTNLYGSLVRNVVFGSVLIVLMAFTAMETIISSMTNPSVLTTLISFVVMVVFAQLFHANNKKGKRQQKVLGNFI